MTFRERYAAWYLRRAFSNPIEVAIYLVLMWLVFPAVFALEVWMIVLLWRAT